MPQDEMNHLLVQYPYPYERELYPKAPNVVTSIVSQLRGKYVETKQLGNIAGDHYIFNNERAARRAVMMIKGNTSNAIKTKLVNEDNSDTYHPSKI